jgi:hypothetical protein
MLRNTLALALLLLASGVNAATLYVTEFIGPPATSVYYQAVNTPANAQQTVTVGVASAQSAAFSVGSKIVRIHTDVACHIEVGGINPTATTSSMRLAADQTEYFVVAAGQKLAVIAAAP